MDSWNLRMDSWNLSFYEFRFGGGCTPRKLSSSSDVKVSDWIPRVLLGIPLPIGSMYYVYLPTFGGFLWQM